MIYKIDYSSFKNHTVRVLLCILTSFLFINSGLAQTVESSIDRNEIKIGEEIIYTFEVETDTSNFVLFPDNQVFLPLEIIESYKTDTTYLDSKYRLIKKYGLTQFDSGSFVIPEQRIVIDNHSFFTDSIPVVVHNVAVDTLKQPMFDIKPAVPVKSPGINLKKILWWIGPLAVIVLILFFMLRRKQKEKAQKLLPPYEEAIEALKKLDHSELLSQNKNKEYYSNLTEIVKRYLDREVDDTALESTSDELIQRLLMHKQAGNFDFSQETILKLDQIFKRADLVKFARMNQESSQARLDRKAIEEIINETKEIIPEPEEDTLKLNQEYLEKLERKKRQKKWIYGISSVIGMLLLVAVLYGTMRGFDDLKTLIFGNPMKEYASQSWVKSEYGNPAVIVETPDVLTRVESEENADLDIFVFGSMKDPLYIEITTAKLNQSESAELDQALEFALTQLEIKGAKNMIVKRDGFETDKGITGVRAFGEFNYMIKPNRVLKESNHYELVLFAQQNGWQKVLVVYRGDSEYAEEIKNRIFQSLELEIIQSYGR